MKNAAGSTYVYVTYIKTTPQKLWDALTDPGFMKEYWSLQNDGDWQVGSGWKMVVSDGKVTDSGKVLQAEPPKHLLLEWHHQFKPELAAEGVSRCAFDLAPEGDEAVKLTITHSMDRADSKFIVGVGGGWPRIISNLKSFIETGAFVLPLPVPK